MLDVPIDIAVLICHYFPSKHDKHDLDLGALSRSDNEEKQNMHSSPDARKQGREEAPLAKPKILASYEGVGKRKRGRPAGTSRIKGKTATVQARRTRAHIGKGPAKISVNESDEIGSHDETTHGKEIKMMEGTHEMASNGSSEIQETEIVEAFESSPRGKVAEQEVEKNIGSQKWYDKVPEVGMTTTLSSQHSERPEKLEVMTDPVQAMLLDMIPSLGVTAARTKDTITDGETQPLDPNAEPKKKKKVSYRDVAGELLKDW